MIIQSKKVWFADQFVEAQIEVKDGKIVDIYEYGTHPEIVWDMAVERFTWEELMMKYHISHTMVAKYRKKAIKELDALYEERDRQTESFILR